MQGHCGERVIRVCRVCSIIEGELTIKCITIMRVMGSVVSVKMVAPLKEVFIVGRDRKGFKCIWFWLDILNSTFGTTVSNATMNLATFSCVFSWLFV